MKRDSEDGEWYNIGIVRGGNSRDKTGSAVSVDKGYVAITSVGDEENSRIPVPHMSSFQKDSEGIIIWATENVDGITNSLLKSPKNIKQSIPILIKKKKNGPIMLIMLMEMTMHGVKILEKSLKSIIMDL